MPKLRDQIITAKDLSEYLATQDDFALELNVYRKATELGLSATHGGTYEDPVTKKHRQYDIRAAFERANSRVALTIECKSLQPTYPLLVSRIPRAEAESFHQLVHSFELTPLQAQLYGPAAPRARAVHLRGPHSIYRAGDFVAKAMTQVGRDEQGRLKSGDGAVYDKWSQALASADELVSFAEDARDRQKTTFFMTFIIPILVVSDGTLWVADYSEDGTLIRGPSQADESVLFVGRDYWAPLRICYTISHLHIFTKRKIASFFDRVVNDIQLWGDIFSQEGFKRALE
jgi:hypothetical protein